ncbi:glycosyltransferase family 9 protein [Acetobacteraceae bacterium ESL0709]|nr:glycosyltransferase family 9 protein [Acetobacteraceae bacterium ESL0697]MDF7677301.1 glycosyltransferase family 9 protein [Acetobacteraceae bacterium ESL0709]
MTFPPRSHVQRYDQNDRILIIKHGALGDIFQAFNAFASIRHAYPVSYIAVLTSSTYKKVLQASPWFDEVLIDDRTKITDWRAARRLWSLFQNFDRVIDLQNSGRTRLYRRLLILSPGKSPLWLNNCNLGSLSSFPTLSHARDMHTIIRQDNFLNALSIIPVKRDIPDWLVRDGSTTPSEIPPSPYIVLVPGAADHRPAKRWPLEHFSALIAYFGGKNMPCVITGTKEQEKLGHELQNAHPHLINLIGKTSLFALVQLLNKASLVIGNDTGPLHIAATMDRPTLTFFSKESDPRRCAPLGLSPGFNRILSCDDLSDLSVERVTDYLDLWLSELFNAKS